MLGPVLRYLRDPHTTLLHYALGNLVAKHRRETGSELVGYYMQDDEDESLGKFGSTWVVISKKKEHLNKLRLVQSPADYGIKEIDKDDRRSPQTFDDMRPIMEVLGVQGYNLPDAEWYPLPVKKSVGEWTDDYQYLWGVFHW